VILAEIVNARRGVGYMVEAARKVLDFDRVYAGIIAIGIAAFLFRWLLTVFEKGTLPLASARPDHVSAGSRSQPMQLIIPSGTGLPTCGSRRLQRGGSG